MTAKKHQFSSLSDERKSQCARLSLEPSKKSRGSTGIGIFQMTTLRLCRVAVISRLAARLLTPAGENVCIPGKCARENNRPAEYFSIFFLWSQIYRNCSENTAGVSTRDKRPRGPGAARWPPIVGPQLGRCHCCSFVLLAQFIAATTVTPSWTGSGLSETGHVAWVALPCISKCGQICCDAWRFAWAKDGKSFFFSSWMYTRTFGRLFPFKSVHARY